MIPRLLQVNVCVAIIASTPLVLFVAKYFSGNSISSKEPIDGPSRVILWGTPRCLSTAFLKAMTHVEDSVVWHEPYLYARKLGPDGADRDRFKKRMMKFLVPPGAFAGTNLLPLGYEGTAGSYQWVKEQLEAEAPGKKLIFSKDMVEGIAGRFDALPNGFRHTFLLRHPIKVFLSIKKMINKGDVRKLQDYGLTTEGYFYQELHELYEYVKVNQLDSKPIIICTDDLQRNPKGIIKAYCKELNIPFTEKLLKWEDDGDKIMQKWVLPKEIFRMLIGIHKKTFQSTRFEESSDLPEKSGLDEDVLEVVNKCMPYYNELQKECLQVE